MSKGMALKRWRERSWNLPAGIAAGVASRLVAAGCTGASVASSRGSSELALWTQGRDAPALSSILAPLGTPLLDRSHDEARILAAHAPAGAVELAPGCWVDPRGRSRLPRGSLRLVIPPAPAFGDGRHPSTRMAACALHALDVRGRRVLDLGCGTGVLGILAHHRGAQRVDFADVDAAAVRSCRAACRLNGIPRPRAWVADLLDGVPETGYDVVLGNLYADLCLGLLPDPRLRRVLPAGTLVLSGIAERRRSQVERALKRAGFRVRSSAVEAWWCCLVAERA